MQFDEHLCDIQHGYNCHDASRGPSAIAELLVISFGTLSPEKICHEDLTHLSTSPVRCSYFTLGNPKSHSYFRLFTLSQKKTNRTCCTAAQMFTYCCLVLPIVCIALLARLGHATGGGVYRVPVRDADELRRRLVATWAEFQHSVVY